jgi:hypothetical protein
MSPTRLPLLGALLVAAAGCSGATSHGAADAGHGAADASADARGVLPDGALVWSGPLPECHWPSTILPPVPDGGIAIGSIHRTALVCGAVTLSSWQSGGGEDDCGSSGTSCSELPGLGPCVMACEGDQYAVMTIAVGSDDFPPGEFPPDADYVSPSLVSGCTPPLRAYDTIMSRYFSSEPPPSVACCPCE